MTNSAGGGGTVVRMKALVRIILTIAIVVPLTSISPSRAWAGGAIVDGSCNSNEVCDYRDDGSGNIADWNSCEPDWYCGIAYFTDWTYWGTSTSPDNRTSAVWNRTDKWANQYQHPLAGGSAICQPAGVYYNKASLNVFGMNDKISSMFTATYAPCI